MSNLERLDTKDTEDTSVNSIPTLSLAPGAKSKMTGTSGKEFILVEVNPNKTLANSQFKNGSKATWESSLLKASSSIYKTFKMNKGGYISVWNSSKSTTNYPQIKFILIEMED
jgi:hypothetical protein